MPATAGGESGVPEGGQPNIVVVMTDDQTLASMSVMPKVERLLAERGVEFTNSFVSNPECCPSRATYLTGQYSHNNGVLRNNSPNGGYPALDGLRTLPVWLQRADYFTAHIGKYLNQYGVFDPTEIPPGWTEWYGSVDFSTYWMYGYTLNENGTLVTYGERETEEPANYQTDVYAARAAEVIARQAPEEDPFFLSVAPLAPHPEVWPANSDIPPFPNPRPAPRHSDAFATAPLPRPPSFNERNVSDKPEAIRDLKRLNPLLIALARERHRSQLA
ncbi:MAG TPA: sulfatase-like hydrolase/transferase, partial [Solirubrobacterales bacterium]|nr:sulfatase-like hydrolase/transferase [Solirubrobacterales bacterium]